MFFLTHILPRGYFHTINARNTKKVQIPNQFIMHVINEVSYIYYTWHPFCAINEKKNYALRVVFTYVDIQVSR